MKLSILGDAKSIHVQKWAKWFAKRGHEVHLISSKNSDIEGVKLHFVEINHLYIGFPYHVFRIKNLIKKINPDIVHSHYITGYGWLGAFSFFKQFVLSVWGSDVFYDAKNSLLKKIMANICLKRADVINTTSKQMANFINKEYSIKKDKIKTFSWGIDLKLFKKPNENEREKLKETLKIEKNSFVILSNRHIKENYNIKTIIDAIPKIIERHKNVIFIFIRGYGSQKYEEELKNLAKNLNVEKNVLFIPKFITPEKMTEYLKISDIFISIPSSDQLSSSVLEGMSCGCIPILSNLEVYKERVVDGKNGFLIPIDVEILAEKIIYCIEHKEIKDKFYEINKKIIEENEDWEKNAENMEKIYEELLKD